MYYHFGAKLKKSLTTPLTTLINKKCLKLVQISRKFIFQNEMKKARNPLYYKGFRDFFVVAGVGFEPHDLRVMSPA